MSTAQACEVAGKRRALEAGHPAEELSSCDARLVVVAVEAARRFEQLEPPLEAGFVLALDGMQHLLPGAFSYHHVDHQRLLLVLLCPSLNRRRRRRPFGFSVEGRFRFR